MNKEFISCEQALELEKLGFDEPCLGYYYTIDNKIWHFGTEIELSDIKDYNDIVISFILSVPLYQQAFRFFREKYGLHTEFFINDDKTFAYMISFLIEETRIDKPILWGFATYEDAEIECINHLIKITNENLYQV